MPGERRDSVLDDVTIGWVSNNHLEDLNFYFQGELRRDDTCLEFTGKGVRLKNMRCSNAGTNQVERDSVKC